MTTMRIWRPRRFYGLCCRGQQRLLGKFEYGNCVLTRHTRKLVKEMIEGVTCLEIVDETLDRHSGPGEDRRSAETIRRSADERRREY